MNELEKLEAEYMQLFKNEFQPFPPYWFDSKDEKKKIKILKEAIKQNKLIINISEDFVEGVF